MGTNSNTRVQERNGLAVIDLKQSELSKDMRDEYTQHILVVDDEEDLVDLLQDLLTMEGFRVTGRTTAKAALELLTADPDDFDMVITDQMMPAMTGLQLIEAIFSVRPEIRTILISGYTRNFDPELLKRLNVREFMRKPIMCDVFVKAIRHILSGHEA